MKSATKRTNSTILAITDFSKSSTNAILNAIRLYKNAHVTLKLLNVFENPGEKANLLISVDDIISRDSKAGLKKQAAEITSLFKKGGLTIQTYSMPGKLHKAIQTITQSDTIDLIVEYGALKKIEKTLG